MPKPPSSFAVFLLWQGAHSGCQLEESQNSFLSPLCGVIWSTTVAGTRLPSFMQETQKGCLDR
ncbi:hypothetical protein CHCC14562_1351 [Bacillus licheniformis]|nr:hypothetical protein CHCC14562_1351 [Bacillus licheniformis]